MLSERVVFYFIKNILEKLPEDIQNKVAVAGGAVRDKLIDAEIKDYDLFVQDKETEDKLMEFLKQMVRRKGSIVSLPTMQKYIKKGYTACNGTLLTLTRALQAVNLDNPSEDALRFYPDGTPRFLGVD